MNEKKTKPDTGNEWNGDGLPPVGCECEVELGGKYRECLVIAHDGAYAVFGYADTYEGMPADAFRPIRSE